MKMTVVPVGRDIIDFYKKFCYNVYVRLREEQKPNG
jgi:hypothetical protein